jgi:hypothetical protein
MAARKNGNRSRSQKGNQNARGNKGNKGRKNATRKRTTGRRGLMVNMSDAQPGTNNDPVMKGFAQKEEQLRQEFEEKMAGLNTSRTAYAASAGIETKEEDIEALTTIPVTRKGTPDLRTAAGRKYMEMHPEFHAGGAPRGD